MRHTLVAILFALASLPRPPVVPTTATRGPAACQLLEPPAAGSAKVWEGRAADFEAFITSAPIERFEDIPVGITHPRRAFFKTGGLAESVAHSRAFMTETKLPATMAPIDPDLWSRMLSLDEPAVTAAIGAWTDRSTRRAVLTRRDKMKAAIASLVLARGHDSVFMK